MRGRFPSTSSWARRYNLLHRPLVNEYKRNLQNWILKLSPHLRFVEPEWEGTGQLSSGKKAEIYYQYSVNHTYYRITPKGEGYLNFFIGQESKKRP